MLALTLLTRIPIPTNHKFEDEDIAKSTLYFPVVGFLLGLVAWGIYSLLVNHVSVNILVFIILVFLTLATGALHEDAVADTFDGFGGGYSKKRILEIMKDSRIGTFGALALIFLILGKFIFLTETKLELIPKSIMAALVLSRWSALPLFRSLKYLRKSAGIGKAFIANLDKVPFFAILISLIFTFAVVIWLFPAQSIYLIVSTLLVIFFSAIYYKKKIDVVTGDCGGTTVQLTELLVYFLVMILI